MSEADFPNMNGGLFIAGRANEKNACEGRGDIIRAEIPEGVTEIAPDAFSGCLNLTQIRLPESLRCIGEGAFSDTELEEIRLPDSLEYVGNGIFGGCDKIKSILWRGRD